MKEAAFANTAPNRVFVITKEGTLKVMTIEEAQSAKLLSDLKEAVVESMECLSAKRKLRNAKNWLK